MYRHILLPQLTRRCKWVATFIALLLVSVAFYSLSANLYVNSKKNLVSSQNSFSTVAILEFYGHTPGYEAAAKEAGLQTESARLCTVEDLDLALLNALPGVKSIDFRKKFGAYIPGAIAYSPDHEENVLFSFQYDLIRFTVQTDQPVAIPARTYRGNHSAFSEAIPITILDSVNPSVSYTQESYRIGSEVLSSVRNYPSYLDLSPTQEQMLAQFNQDFDVEAGELILMPGVEYVAAVEILKGNEAGTIATITVTFDWYGANAGFFRVKENGILSDLLFEKAGADQPIGIWRWEDVQQNSKLKQYFEEVAKAYQYTSHSFQVMTTDHLEGIPAFYQRNAYIGEGTSFSESDYTQGNPVCIISETLAKTQGWSVGDRIDLSLYSYDILHDRESIGEYRPDYTQRGGGFFHQGEYEIVGIWREKTVVSPSQLEKVTESVAWNTILVPAGSVQNLDAVEAPASGSRLTVHLENGMMDEFLEAASKVTLSESADEVKISAFDQGYSQAQDSLQSMLGTAQFLLTLSSVLLLVAGVLLAFFYTQSQKQNMALMRLLGCSRRQAGTMSLLGSLLILLPGGVLGTAAGHLLTNRVASAILNSTNRLDKPEYAGFREIFGVQAEVEFALSAQTAVSAAALGAAAGLFLVFCLLFTLLLLRKEPRAALTDK